MNPWNFLRSHRGLAALFVAPIALVGIGWLGASCLNGETSLAPAPTEAIPAGPSTPTTPHPEDGTPFQFNRLEIEIPEFATFDELTAYIGQRHDRLRRYAQDEPDRALNAGVTLAHPLTSQEFEDWLSDFGIYGSYLEYTGGGVEGGFGLIAGNTLEDERESLLASGAIGPDDALLVTYFSGRATASNWAALADRPEVALVYADHSIDQAEGVIGENVTFGPPPSIYDVYLQLSTEAP